MSDKLANVINWFLSKETMTYNKLQTLLYYSQAWTVAILNDSEEELDYKLFDESFEAWEFGPAIPEVYERFNDYDESALSDAFDNYEFNEDVEDILEEVLSLYGDFSEEDLGYIVRHEKPWREARLYDTRQNVIPLESIYSYFAEKQDRYNF
ncbi:DUF4065 domain-containing protein [Salinicoccus sp. ID82-1]|uniref:Panacea domain-containing protein n=1 Tax=Salinicoccus sp. ID82-1 TaxID=2820269 RepID=UPI001F33CA46|nr:type II toxin-antitoxin system antitoxin SocA domain-containing protein [Salinicoccus sp. ID82-1]MCG1009420.1 DUF4065 domain-containing protein [Salinicoccus sp. ID82-1]